MSYKTDVKTIVKRPTHLGRKPRSAAALLRQTHDFLAEEGRWVRGAMFKDGDAKDAYEKGFCDSWGACSVGAIGIVSGDFAPSVRAETYQGIFNDLEDTLYEWNDDYGAESPLAIEACAYLSLVVDPERTRRNIIDGVTVADDEWVGDIISWNDASNRKRTQVLQAFATAAELAAKPGSFESIACKHLGITDEEMEDY